MAFARVVNLANTRWRAVLVEDPSRQEIRVMLWAPDHRVRWVASLLWDAVLCPGDGRSACIARARALARDAMKCAANGADWDTMPFVDMGLTWTRARAPR